MSRIRSYTHLIVWGLALFSDHEVRTKFKAKCYRALMRMMYWEYAFEQIRQQNGYALIDEPATNMIHE